MILKIILACIVIFIIFILPNKSRKHAKSPFNKFMAPIFVILLAAGLSVLKIYFVYKLAILLFVLVLAALTAWSLRDYFRH